MPCKLWRNMFLSTDLTQASARLAAFRGLGYAGSLQKREDGWYLVPMGTKSKAYIRLWTVYGVIREQMEKAGTDPAANFHPIYKDGKLLVPASRLLACLDYLLTHTTQVCVNKGQTPWFLCDSTGVTITVNSWDVSPAVYQTLVSKYSPPTQPPESSTYIDTESI